ncbi:hypothetical protein I6F34_01135 [Bradyrhizobium sp. BRP05]|nr:hypothetical protein [Bradyrhizobium sp. BRP05]
MFVTAVAVMCKLMVAHATLAPNSDCTSEEQMVEEIVTDTDKDPSVDFFACQIRSQVGVADWKSHHPIYFKDAWRVARIKCVPGHYEPRGSV